MADSIARLTEQLKCSGIRPSYQRVRVLEYLHSAGGHPTVDEIYRALSPGIPSLSKVTIYNTLHAFVQAGLVRVVEIDDAQMRYDLAVDDHGHFLCQRCGTIYNFAVHCEPAGADALRQFVVTQRNVYFKGLCPNCREPSHSQPQETNA